MATGRFGTLTVQGIPWNYFSHEGQLAFGHKAHAIIPHEGFFLIKEMGKVIFVGLTMVECLEVAHEYVWEYHANRLQPSWTCAQHTANTEQHDSLASQRGLGEDQPRC